MSENKSRHLFSNVSPKTWNSIVKPELLKEDTPKKKRKYVQWFSSKTQKVALPALVALSLLSFGAILLSLGVGLRYGASAGLIVLGLISLALGVLIGWDS